MTSITWPVSLPQVMRLDGLSGKKKSNVIRTTMDAGPAKARRRYSVTTKTFEGSVILNGTQRAILESWHDNTLGNGALRFTMKDPQTLKVCEFRFTDDYTEDQSGDGLWIINLPLEKMNA